MRTILLTMVLMTFFSISSKAVTLKSNFTITNRVIESESFFSTEPAMKYTNDGTGIYTITDTHTDANIANVNSPSISSWWGYGRRSSLITITMVGQRLGHTFQVKGKIGNSSISYKAPVVIDSNGNFAFRPGIRGTCTAVSHNSDYNNMGHSIEVDANITNTGVGCKTDALGYASAATKISSVGVSRVFYLDIKSLQNDIAYRSAPPDVYIGSNTFNGISLTAGSNNSYRIDIPYINEITIIKKPYFDNVTLLSADNIFTVKTVDNRVLGALSIPYVMSGQFTPYDKVTLNVTSMNNFHLIHSTDATKRIPYNLSTTLGSRKFQLISNASGTGSVIFTDLPKSTSSMQGRYDASFLVDKNSVIPGEYTDTITAVYQIDLIS
ncbi:hypothetical protein [Escherichia coli]|uniref:hypothetical protein n=1 Tax=Escherichia coli TaxID=562 RepID=UPI0010ABB622|nr:hypothetical protein [Escherichia coli]EEV3841307.1 hypothetical protein [Escherichia coli]EEX2797649.1 hypothetical protein [Escherichia coli]EFL6174272.1 hypothetical protein [Escherichia coli]EFU6057330.1 hypothetical protein [Escherichia coli]EKC6260432.1 hypothetical protein [Escherichia coli]